MNAFVPHTISEQGISLFTNLGMKSVPKTHPNYLALVAKLKSGDHTDLESILNVPDAIAEATDGKVTIIGDSIRYRGRTLAGVFADRIMRLHSEGSPVQYMLDFLTNLQKNPSKTARDELALFLDHTNIPLTQDGHFLAWKRVGLDYKSLYDRKTDNTPGSTPEMPRYDVDDNRNRTCSAGLHFAAFGYLDSYASDYNTKTVIVKIHPADVVSIPSDYNNMKGRACRYFVVGEVGQGITHDDMNRAAIINTDGSAFNMPETDVPDEPEEEEDFDSDQDQDDSDSELSFDEEDGGVRVYYFKTTRVRIFDDIFGHKQIVIEVGDKEKVVLDTAHADISNAENIALERCQELFGY